MILTGVAALILGTARATKTIKHQPPQGDPCARKWAESFTEHAEHYPEIATDQGAMLGWFANAMVASQDHEAAIWRKRVEDIRKMVEVQTEPGFWDRDDYMHGMANGLILALATMENQDPTFLEHGQEPKTPLEFHPDAFAFVSEP